MDPLFLVILIALVLTITVMIMGLMAMGGGGPIDKHFGTKLMWARVGLQGFAILLLFAALFLQ